MAASVTAVVLGLVGAWWVAVESSAAAAPLVEGMSFSFYRATCPSLEKIVRDHLRKVFRKDIGQAAALLRIHFHDCFVQGCDASVLLDGSASGPGEKGAPPNLTLRKEAFVTINEIQRQIQKQCGQKVVSCSDIAALAARDSVFLSGGPDYRVPLGRRDSLNFATQQETLDSLPSPASKTPVLIAALSRIGLDATDLVALSGGHTIGIGHCTSFQERLYPAQDPTMGKTYASNLKATCPVVNSSNTTPLDIRSPNKFDNKYYVDLMNREGLFTSDQDLYTDRATRSIVTNFAVNETAFMEQFARSMVKMGQLSVLTGTRGEIRTNCSARNSASRSALWSIVDEDGDAATV